ncbi:methyltransferase type 12 [Arthrobacter sp. MYb214]|uniref:class I SAM-dependent methyltransferase n=1 Tax=unclassified Arthrobacter TaxID=235627 RepID=UPI000CFBC7C7|nr:MULTISPECIES: class I SAM-dependent methyltransferase [unclassified Arthrobacter]PQZ87451.1 methyltransferase type 12 [Arthrobacter sp. MYb222]PRB78709.1 methyltransferase type 12 [Arthrobacter sp. MYb214]
MSFADYDPRLIALYDTDNPDGPDHDYYRALAAGTKANRILDLGSGTGLLTITLAIAQRTVVGVDPSPVMMDYARQRPNAEQVTWIDGDASAIDGGPFDLMVMTGNVAQHIPDPQWAQTLEQLRAAAATGAVLAFESRNPSTRAWETWNDEEAVTRDTQFGPLTEWCDAEETSVGLVRLTSYAKIEHSQEVLVEKLDLAFRSAEQISADLVAAGFNIRAIWGDWQKNRFNGEQPLMIFEAEAIRGVDGETAHG